MLARLRPLCGRPNPLLPGCSRWFSAPAGSLPGTAPVPVRVPFRPPTPLPPTLPYSAHSRPFQTHLHILSLALVHSPDASWEIYKALHKSLRSYIPADTLFAVVDHQTEPTKRQVKQRWRRLKDLLQHAKKSNIPLGNDRLQRVLAFGLRYVLSARKDLLEAETGILRGLWTHGGIPSDRQVRRNYVWFTLHRYGPAIAFKVVEEIVEAGFEAGMEGVAGATLVPVQSESLTSLPGPYLDAIRRIAWLWTRGVRIAMVHAVRPMSMLAQYPSGRRKAEEAVARLAGELRAGDEEHGAAFLEEALQCAKRGSRSPMQILTEDHETMSFEEVSARLPSFFAKPLTLDGAELAVTLLAKLRRSPDPPDNLYAHEMLILALRKHFPSPRALDLISTLAQQLIEPPIALQHLKRRSLREFLTLCIESLSHLPTQSHLATIKTLYEAARPEWQWNTPRNHVFEAFLRALLAKPHQQTIYASRLYAEAVGDGLKPSASSLRALMSAHGRTFAAQSSQAYTERYLQDYLFAGHPTNLALAMSLVRGPSYARDGEASLRAFELVRRAFGSQTVPAEIHEAVLKATSRDPKLWKWTIDHIFTMIQHGPEPSPGCFEAAIFSLVGRGQADAERLGKAVILFRQMIQRELSPSSLTMSYLVIGLLDDNRLDAALRLFNTAKLPLKSRAVGHLMVHLAISGRAEEARAVEAQWRALSPGAFDKAVVGARILVDQAQVESKQGWKPTPAFRQFLESRLPEQDEQGWPVDGNHDGDHVLEHGQLEATMAKTT